MKLDGTKITVLTTVSLGLFISFQNCSPKGFGVHSPTSFSEDSSGPPEEPLISPDVGMAAVTDPGSGVWIPDVNAKPLIVVVDQGGLPQLTVLPGCINNKYEGSTAPQDFQENCDRDRFTAKVGGEWRTFRFQPGTIFSIRYHTGGTEPPPSRFDIRNPIGGNIGVKTRISMSSTPGDMNGMGLNRCSDESPLTPSLSFIAPGGTTKYGCQMDFAAKPFHYLNIESLDDQCLDSGCKNLYLHIQ